MAESTQVWQMQTEASGELTQLPFFPSLAVVFVAQTKEWQCLIGAHVWRVLSMLGPHLAENALVGSSEGLQDFIAQGHPAP